MVTYGAVKGAPKGAFILTLDSPVSHFTIELSLVSAVVGRVEGGAGGRDCSFSLSIPEYTIQQVHFGRDGEPDFRLVVENDV